MTREQKWLYVLFGLFIVCLIISSVTASKLWAVNLLGYQIAIPVGTSLFAITFLCTDVIAEVWGRKHSYWIVWIGLVCRLAALFFFYFAVSTEPVSYYLDQEAYAKILSSSTNIIIAGIVAYLVSQINDVFLFHYLKERDEGKNLLWKRNMISTLVSQLVDSFVFVLIAFAMTMETSVIINIIIAQVIFKWFIAIIDTPFVYIIRNFIQKKRIFDFTG